MGTKKDPTRTVTDVATMLTNNYLFVTFMELFVVENNCAMIGEID